MQKEINELTENLRGFAESRIEQYRLEAIDHSARIVSSILLLLIQLVVFLFVAAFLTMALSAWLTLLLGSAIYANLFIASGCAICLVVVLTVAAKPIHRLFQNLLIKELLKNQENHDS